MKFVLINEIYFTYEPCGFFRKSKCFSYFVETIFIYISPIKSYLLVVL